MSNWCRGCQDRLLRKLSNPGIAIKAIPVILVFCLLAVIMCWYQKWGTINAVGVLSGIMTFVGLIISLIVLGQVTVGRALGYEALTEKAKELIEETRLKLDIVFYAPNFGHAVSDEHARKFYGALCRKIGILSHNYIPNQDPVARIIMMSPDRADAFISETANTQSKATGDAYKFTAYSALVDFLSAIRNAQNGAVQLYVMDRDPFTSVIFLSESRCISATTKPSRGKEGIWADGMALDSSYQLESQRYLFELLLPPSNSPNAQSSARLLSLTEINNWLDEARNNRDTACQIGNISVGTV